MATIEDLVRLRPWAYHVTTPSNQLAIARWRRLRSAADLLQNSQERNLLRDRRTTSTTVTVEGVKVEIRDQSPLQAGHITFEEGYSLRNLLDELNHRIFLWPGTEMGPIKSGINHIERYSDAGPVVIIRCRLQRLLDLNADAKLFVTRCNSGGPRSNPKTGRAVRGRSTFLQLADVDYPLSAIKELSYIHSAALPDDAEWASRLDVVDGWQGVWPGAMQR